MTDDGDIWSGIRAGLTYEQNAILRAYGATTYEAREQALDQIASDITDRVLALADKREAHNG